MKKLRLVENNLLTFEEGCNKYLDNCRGRNLREGTINHYKQSYSFFYIHFKNIFIFLDLSHTAHLTLSYYTTPFVFSTTKSVQSINLLLFNPKSSLL